MSNMLGLVQNSSVSRLFQFVQWRRPSWGAQGCAELEGLQRPHGSGQAAPLSSLEGTSWGWRPWGSWGLFPTCGDVAVIQAFMK